MDYTQLFEDYFYSQGDCTTVTVVKYDDANYTVDVYYGDEEIENYLGSGLNIALKLSDVGLADDGMAVCFVPSLLRLMLPNLNITGKNCSNPEMACSLLEEVARVANQFLHNIDLGSENWIDI